MEEARLGKELRLVLRLPLLLFLLMASKESSLASLMRLNRKDDRPIEESLPIAMFIALSLDWFIFSVRSRERSKSTLLVCNVFYEYKNTQMTDRWRTVVAGC